MACVKLPALLIFSVTLFLIFPGFAEQQNASSVATGSKWVKPIGDRVLVQTSTGTVVEPIGVLTKDSLVEVLEEANGWYKIRFARENAEFVGWVRMDEMTVEGTPPEPPNRVPKPPEPEPTKKEEPKPEKKILSVLETHEKLLELRQVPVNSTAQYKKTYDRSGMRDKVSEGGSTAMSLFGGQKAKLDVLAIFDPDEVVAVYVEDKIRELKALREVGHPDFARVIDCYVRGLEAYLEGKTSDFLGLVDAAERFWKRIPGIEVGF